jgi:hypothetical protein
VPELTITAEPEIPEPAAPEPGTNGNAAAVAVSPAKTEPSWTPPVVKPPSPSPEPVFAEPRAEAHAPVESPSSPVPGVKLPPRRPSNRAAFAIVGVLLVAGGVAIYAGMTGEVQKPPVNVPSPPQPTTTPQQPSGSLEANKPGPTTANPANAENQAPTTNPATAETEGPAAKATRNAEVSKSATEESAAVPSKQLKGAHAPTPSSPGASVKAEATKARGEASALTGNEDEKTREKAVPAGAIEIVTTPPGANIYIDGAPQGTTPAHVSVTAGKHHVVLLAEHQRMVRQDVRLSPQHPLEITLEEAKLPPEIAGPAGLKVRCKATQGELRVLVDGADTGLACPNDERISVKPGPHKIGLYSPRTDETHEIEHDVLDGTNSTRVYTKY